MVRLGVALLIVLVFAPLAAADSIVYATDRAAVPVRILEVPLTGNGHARTVSTSHVLDLSPDGRHTVDADERLLRVDGAIVAQVGWPIDEARFSPSGGSVAFTAVSEAHCGPAATKCATWELWLVHRDGSGLRMLSPDARYPRWSPNGARLAFLGGFAPVNEGGTVAVQNVATGRRTWFEYGADTPPAWSPDGTQIAYAGLKGLRIATLSPRAMRTVAPVGWLPTFSPDGKRLAYLAGTTLRVLRIGTGTSVRVARDATAPLMWTARKGILHVVSDPKYPYNSQVASVGVDGSHRKTLTAFEPMTTIDRIWGRGGVALVEGMQSRYAMSTIDAIDTGSGSVRQLTHENSDDLSPTAASDGTLAYARGSAERFGWYCLAVAGRCVTTASNTSGIREPIWSPDAQRLAYLETVGTRTGLWVVGRTGGNRELLTDDPAFTGWPSWAPDGRSIVFASARLGPVTGLPQGQAHLWVVDVVTKALRELNTGGVALSPAWSPDGRSIVFLGGSDGGSGPFNIDLYDVGNGAVTTLAPYGNSPMGIRPAWAPDSSRIAYRAIDGSLHMLDRTGGDRRLLDWTTPGSDLAWSVR